LISDPEKNHIYKWDVLGRLMEIRGASNALVAEFRYNALGYRIAERIAAEGEDWTRLVYDARWRIVATYKIDVSQDEEALSERFVYHAAGLDGLGGGSYIDALVLRDRDADGNGSLEERHYYCQSWRHDVVAIIDHQGRQIEHMRYTPYGVPISIPMSDKDRNGELEQADVDAMVAAITAYTNPSGSGYQVEFDNDLDGDIDFTDLSLTIAQMNAIGTDPIGRRVLSAYGHRAGYAGYQWMPAAGLYHVRHRCYDPLNGTWISKDPAEYIDGASLYLYVGGRPLAVIDPLGMYGVREWWNDTVLGAKEVRDYWLSPGPLNSKPTKVLLVTSGGAAGAAAAIATKGSKAPAIVVTGYGGLRLLGWQPTRYQKINEGLDAWCFGFGAGTLFTPPAPGSPPLLWELIP
jgi:RHS repeat-associated protein